jgi:small subunit ribosomal protein S3
MGQKVNPVGFRTGVMVGWKSRWYASKQEFSQLLFEDTRIRGFVKKRKDKFGKALYPAIAKIEIERTRDEVKVILFSARPGILIGRKGERVEELQNELQNLTGRRINIKIEEITRPEIVAQLVAEDIAEQLIKRSSFRRTMKRSIEQTMEAGAKGIKIQLGGRLGGAEMSRREKQIAGSMPLSTLRAKIDYGFAEAKIAQGH